MKDFPKCCIYGLVDPRTNEIRYIGKTKNGMDRIRCHTKLSSLKSNTYKNNWIKELLSLNLSFKIIPIKIEENSINLNSLEILYIKIYKDLGVLLTNGTDGGDGRLGCKQSEESKKKISAAGIGKKHTLESRIKMSVSIKESYKNDPQFREKSRLARIGQKRTEDSKQRMRIAHLGITHSEETMKKMSKSHNKNKTIYNFPETIIGRKCKPFICLETGKIYYRQLEFAKEIQAHPQYVRRVLKKQRYAKSVKGFHIEYLEENNGWIQR